MREEAGESSQGIESGEAKDQAVLFSESRFFVERGAPVQENGSTSLMINGQHKQQGVFERCFFDD